MFHTFWQKTSDALSWYAEYYRKFCYNFSIIEEPLTNLLGKRVKFIWTDDCQKYFDKLKLILRR